jgi:hypothetical protein
MLSAAMLFFFAARFLGNKTHKTFVLVVGAMTCFLFPIGTVLGVFTLMVLSRDSMKHLFRS